MRVLDIGEVLVEGDGPPIRPGGPRSSALLCLLTLSINTHVSTDRLIEAVWGDRTEESNSAALDTLVWRLRRVLEPDREPRRPALVLVTEAGGYRLLLNEDQVDSHRFEILADETRDLLLSGEPDRTVRRCEDALKLWRGRPFGAHADEPWAVASRTRLEEIHAEVRERRVDALLAIGNPVRAAADVAELIHETPFREGLWSRLMLASYRAGRVEQALQHYLHVRQLLRDQLGTEPGRELTDLHQRILLADPGLDLSPIAPATRPPSVAGSASEAFRASAKLIGGHAAVAGAADAASGRMSPPPQLPRWLTPLIGRDTELKQLEELVLANTVTTLIGSAGCGKTRLAVAVADAVGDTFPDGVWFVDLAAIDNPDLVVDVTMSAIGISAARTGSAAEQLRAHVRNRRLLLLLDNCEHVLPRVREMVSVLLDPDAQFALLATSREPLDLDGELTLTLPPLPVRRLDDLGAADDGIFGQEPKAASASPAAELFLARVRQVMPELIVDPPTLVTVERICAAADGVPLALELGAARVRSYTLAEIAEQMAADPSTVSRPGGNRAARRYTIGAAIEGSYRLLSEEEKTAHRRLAVLPGLFTTAAAAAVIHGAAGDLTLPPATDLLADLVHRSMLVSQPSQRPDGRSRFTQLATVRAHARRVLEAGGETVSAERRRDDWVLQLMDRRPRLTHLDDDGWYAEADSAFDTIRASLQRHLLDQPSPFGPRALCALTNFWFYRGRISESIRWLEPALPRVDFGTRDGALVAITYAGIQIYRGQLNLVRSIMAELTPYEPTTGHADEEIVALLSVMVLGATEIGELTLTMMLADQITTLSRHHRENATIKQLSLSVDCLVAMLSQTLDSQDQPEILYHQAVSSGNPLAAWVVAAGPFMLAVAGNDARNGLVWTDRCIDAVQALGSQSTGLLIEYRANFVFATGDMEHAVLQHASARSQLRRSGVRWPRQPGTADVLARAQTALGARRFDEAWLRGSQLDSDEARKLILDDRL